MELLCKNRREFFYDMCMHGDFILKLLRTNSDKIKGSSKSEVDSRYYTYLSRY